MVYNHTYTPSAPIGTTTLGHGVDPDDYSTLDDYQLPMRRRLEDGESLGVLGLGSGDLNLFERAGFVVPFDWECQTGTSGGVYPCPNGIPSACGERGVSSVCAKCYCEVWGNQWWNDPYVSQSYINFKVTRYEMADAFGVEFYSTEGDTLKVFSTGDVHFKPDNAERTVYINEQVEYEYETDIDRRLSTAEAVLGDIDLTLPIDHARLVPSPKGEPAALKDAPVNKARRRLGGRRNFISAAGSFSLGGGSNRAGND
ncbi:hypothetical protein JL721_11872 [Aureococcus anophagefferens]|nr:hypothetical protein JL721_11872 [Aureococcus anophagefferens]